MKKRIIEYAKSLKIEYMGIVSAEPMRELENVLSARRKQYGTAPFENEDIEKRVNPLETMAEAKSIIVCLFPYANGGGGTPDISKYARIPDYHIVVMQYLNQICDFIRQTEPSCKLMPYTDSGALADKYLAYKAGLGFFWKKTPC